jgi:hypothetical protein
MLVNSLAISVVANQYPTERLLDAGPAQCPQLEVELEKQLESFERHGEDLAIRVARNTLLAEWVASDSALYYVWPEAGRFSRLDWSEVKASSVSRATRVVRIRGGKVRTVTFSTRSSHTIQIQTGSMAAKALHKIAKAQA